MKSFLSYVPHGINQDNFINIDEFHDLYPQLQTFKKELLGGREYDFVLLFNARNIRRKQVPDAILAFKLFLDKLPQEKAEKCCFILHTQPIDDNGTDLFAVRDMIFGDRGEKHIIFTKGFIPGDLMKFLYNSSDACILISSNEGWGLSITEAMMCGKMIICNVTGGMQDQLRFEDENGAWINFNEKFTSNHLGKYKKHGEWGIGVFPSNVSIQGSPITPYINDDRVDFREVADAILEIYNMEEDERKRRGLLGRKWVTSAESGMSMKSMTNKIIQSIDHLFDNWEGREAYEIIKIEKRKKKYIENSVSH
jgi:glycosyltransferase involved in cell wall biosynthesis